MKNLPVFGESRQSGQALLLILLVMSLVLTLVISSVSRSVTDVEVSEYEDKTIRAFDAAQAGIEKAVIGSVTSGVPVSLGNNASFTPIIETIPGGIGNVYRYPIELVSGESANFYFVKHQDNGNDIVTTCQPGGGTCITPTSLRVCWARLATPADEDFTPALHLEFYYNTDPDSGDEDKWENMTDLSDIEVTHIVVDPNTVRTAENNFTSPVAYVGGPPDCVGYGFSSYYTATDAGYNGLNNGALLFLRVTMLYNEINNNGSPQPLGITINGGNLPSQGSVITSTGQSGDVYRKLVLYQGYPEIPSEIGNVIYSRLSIVK